MNACAKMPSVIQCSAQAAVHRLECDTSVSHVGTRAALAKHMPSELANSFILIFLSYSAQERTGKYKESVEIENMGQYASKWKVQSKMGIEPVWPCNWGARTDLENACVACAAVAARLDPTDPQPAPLRECQLSRDEPDSHMLGESEVREAGGKRGGKGKP